MVRVRDGFLAHGVSDECSLLPLALGCRTTSEVASRLSTQVVALDLSQDIIERYVGGRETGEVQRSALDVE